MFKLNIECTRDISELHINFADGTSVVTSVGSKSKTQPLENKQRTNQPKTEEFLDLDTDFGGDGRSTDVVRLPEINLPVRVANVAQELQNLDI